MAQEAIAHPSIEHVKRRQLDVRSLPIVPEQGKFYENHIML
jgi:hypothetical protein